MTIEAIETLRLEEFPNLIWVLVEDDEGVKGLGETFFGAAAVEAYIHESMAPLLLGFCGAPEPTRRRVLPYVGPAGAGVETRASSSIDLALWDLRGKRADRPVWDLLGGRCRESVRAYNTCAGSRYVRGVQGQRSANWGIGNEDGRYEDLDAFLSDAGALAEDLLSEGISAMKIWPFDRYAEENGGQWISPDQLAEGIEPFRKIRAAVGDRIQIMLEMHGLWSAPAAVDIARALAPYDIYWIEDPIPLDGFGALADLRRLVPQKITASETLAGRTRFMDLMAAKAVDIVMLDLGWCGGLTEAKAIAAIAEAHCLPIAPHDCTGPVVFAASCHLSTHAPNALIQERVRAFHCGWYREVADGLPIYRDGFLAPGAGSGFGIEMKPEVFSRPDVIRRRTAL
ncbi:MAG: mandelate racemase/muconate lactonizing enzyme family protein [Pseudomonadota bacterium]